MAPHVLAAARGQDASRIVSEVLSVSGVMGTPPERQRLVSSGPVCIGWPASSPWVGVASDEHLTVVVDGVIHGDGLQVEGPSAQDRSAQWLLRRIHDGPTTWFERLIGDWVIAVIHHDSNRLEIVRDALGVRPWFDTSIRASYVGCSDIGSLAALDGIDRTIDEHRIAEHVAVALGAEDRTWYRSIKRLRGGHRRTADDRSTKTTSSYEWKLEYRPVDDWDELVDECRALTTIAVADRMTWSGTTVAELSGGLDSSSIVGTLALSGESPLVGRMLSTSPDADEREFSDAVLEYFGIKSVDAEMFAPSLDDLSVLARQRLVPPPPFNVLMHRGLHRLLAERGVSQILTGVGGDDLFAAPGVGACVISALQLRDRDELVRYLRWGARHPSRLWGGLLRPTLSDAVESRRTPVGLSLIEPGAAIEMGLSARFVSRSEPTGVRAIDDRLRNLLVGELQRIFEELARASDPGGMRSSHPFFDPRLIEALMVLDPSASVRNGVPRSLQRAAFADRLPSVVVQRRTKAVFNDLLWDSFDSETVESRLATSPLLDLDAINADATRGFVDKTKNDRAGSVIPLGRLLEIDSWLRIEQR